MAITSTVQAASGISPNKPGVADFFNSAVNSGTYETLLNITGKGVITRVSLGANNSISNKLLSMRFTIDGGAANVITPGGTDGENHMRGFAHDSIRQGTIVFDYFCNVQFKTSALIEIVQNSGTSTGLRASCDYSLQV